jgi:hypothetical protein
MATPMHAMPVADNVARYLARPRQLLIHGEWVNAASGRTFPTYNPATGEVLAHMRRATARTLTMRSPRPAPPSITVHGQRSRHQNVDASSGNSPTLSRSTPKHSRNSNPLTTASRLQSLGSPTCPPPLIIFVTWLAGQRRSRGVRLRSPLKARNSLRTHCVNP